MAGDFVKHARILSLLTLLSRILGLFRETAMAAAFGVSDAAGAFWVAFRIPNLFRALFGEGGMTVAFVPVFTSLIEQKDEEGAKRLANIVTTLLFAVLATLTVVGEALIFFLGRLPDGTPRFHLILLLSAIMLPFVLSVCMIGYMQSLLNVRGHFVVPGFAPIILNIFVILAAAATRWGPLAGYSQEVQIQFVALSVLAAGVVQLLVHIPILHRHGFRFRPAWDLASPHLRQVLILMLPMVVGMGIVQINTFVDAVIATALSQPEGQLGAGQVLTHFQLFGHWVEYPMKQGAVVIINNAQRLYDLPVGLFTIAIGTAIFPALARHAHHKDHRGIAETLNRGLRLVTFIGLPCTVGIIVIATPLVRLILQHGAFGPESTVRVAQVTSVYVLGLVFFSILHLVTRAFFALQETKLPVKSSACAALANFLLNITLVWYFDVAGLALSTVIAAAGQVAFLTWMLRRRIGRLGLRALLSSLWRTAAASLLMGLAAWGAMSLAGRFMSGAGWDSEGQKFALVSLVAGIVVGAGVYLLTARLMGMTELSDILSRRRSEETPAPPASET